MTKSHPLLSPPQENVAERWVGINYSFSQSSQPLTDPNQLRVRYIDFPTRRSPKRPQNSLWEETYSRDGGSGDPSSWTLYTSAAEATEEDPFFADMLSHSPQLRKLWEEHAPARRLALSLIGMRRKAGLTQKQLATAANWDQGYVSRLESGRGPLPEAATVQRYAEACGGKAGYVLVDKLGVPTFVGV